MNSTLTTLTDALDTYDPLSLECDGLIRVISATLTQHNIPHTVMRGTVMFGDDAIPLHFWIDLSPTARVDYRARMWLGNSAPHGIFDPAQTEAVYDGNPHDFGFLPPMVLTILTEGMGIIEIPDADAIRDALQEG